MPVNITRSEVAELIGKALRSEVTEHAEAYEFDLVTFGAGPVTRIRQTKASIDRIIASLQSFNASEDLALFNAQNIVIPLKEESRIPRLTRFGIEVIPLTITDNDNQIEYVLDWADEAYTVWLLRLIDEKSPEFFRSLLRIRHTRINEVTEEPVSALQTISRSGLRTVTLKVSTLDEMSSEKIKHYATSFLFHFTYNTNIALIPYNSLDGYVQLGRLSRLRRTRTTELDSPRRLYNSDLVFHYQMAVSSDIPLVQFLGYYHIAEHFFEAVFEDELIETVRSRITRPEFSYRRRKDIRLLVKDLSKSLRFRNEQVIFSEQEALRLTFNRYLNTDELREQIEHYDDSLIRYYRNSSVDFSDGDKVDFELDDQVKIKTLLAARIYKTRNAIVHSKETDRSKYIPFNHDIILRREIPLMQFVSEQIVINTARMIE